MNPRKRAEWAKVIVAAAEMSDSVQHTSLDTYPDHVPEGAREVALVTVCARAQDFAFEPMMDALEKLSTMDNWGREFLVSPPDTGKTFHWKKALFRRYASFEDFYNRELQETWGRWDRLLDTWQRVKAGEISAERGKELVQLGRHGAPAGNQNAAKDRPENKGDNITFERGTAAAYTLARLKRDRPDLAERVVRGELSANAAAKLAGWRRDKTPLEKILALLPKLNATEIESVAEQIAARRSRREAA